MTVSTFLNSYCFFFVGLPFDQIGLRAPVAVPSVGPPVLASGIFVITMPCRPFFCVLRIARLPAARGCRAWPMHVTDVTTCMGGFFYWLAMGLYGHARSRCSCLFVFWVSCACCCVVMCMFHATCVVYMFVVHGLCMRWCVYRLHAADGHGCSLWST